MVSRIKKEYSLKVFEDRMVTNILHNNEIHNFCPSLNIIRMVKLDMERCAEHVARNVGDENYIKTFG